MDLRTYLSGLPADEREAFAVKCGTTAGHMRNVMYGQKTCATDLAVQVEKQSGRAVTRQELRSDWADHWPELTAFDADLREQAAPVAPAGEVRDAA